MRPLDVAAALLGLFVGWWVALFVDAVRRAEMAHRAAEASYERGVYRWVQEPAHSSGVTVRRARNN